MTSPQSVTVRRSTPESTQVWKRRWADSRWRWVGAGTVPAAYGVLAGLWTPRGPMTTAQALTAMVLGLLTGLAVGRATRSRWAMLLAPVVFILVLELMRVRLSGPSVDGIHLGSTYGLMALLLNRGFHGLLTLLPMVLGAALGAAVARRRSAAQGGRVSVGGWVRRGVAGLTALALVTLGVLVARPASTDPIVNADGRPVRGSIAELTTVPVGRHELGLMLRGVSTSNPVLLFLAGGPGGTELGAMRRHSEALERSFVVATLDQRGAGKSYGELDPTDTMTVDAAVADVVAVTRYLRDRFGQQDVYLVGQSWGSTLGVLAVQQHPELYRAFVGVGQMVSQAATDKIFYADTLAWARDHGNSDLVDTLEANGPPPYSRDDILAYEPALSYEQEVHPYDHSANDEGAGQMGENIFVREYSLVEQVRIFGATLDVFSVLYPQLQRIDFRTQANRLQVPTYLAEGRHEAPGRLLLAQEWFKQLDAPSKSLTWFETSGHRPLWEQPEQFAELMTRVLSETTGTSSR